MKLSQSLAAREIANLLRERYAFDRTRCQWFGWNLTKAEWETIELADVHAKIGYWLDHIVPSGYSIAFLRGVEAFLRLHLQSKFERDWSADSQRIWVRLVEVQTK